ncbi:hypothetical protein RA2_04304 [Roseovarius sp. A-2]|uniref:hypothetical protein n=1 Tax=Roseovarius sp. A-2 TaxID=1570360 RepID=UPI0009B503EE|nr:hypothetical protein [Roseovarius sp. A-2]GAW37228.1 hypothetical protein RA2_04304 [Roseovarius sp. A-2]
MLVMTTNALEAGTIAPPFPSWPGLHVLIVLPGSECDRQALEALNDRFIIIEWLQEPADATVLLCDVIGWLERRLDEDEGPLLYIDHPLGKAVEPDDPDQIPPLAVDATFDPDANINRLVLGEMIATSPLLPDLFRKLDGRPANDTQFTEILTDLFVWKDA